jgi:quercetin dioxygenase-like cupin family protein
MPKAKVTLQWKDQESRMSSIIAEVCGPTSDLRADIAFFTKDLGMRMEMIYPADDPQVAVFSGHGVSLRLDQENSGAPLVLRLRSDAPEGLGGFGTRCAPGGTQVEVVELNPPLVLPETLHSFVVRRLADQAPWVVGRAGMHYRDLIPDRLGGSIIASHIRIPDGGPVPDMVHYHTVGFQLIYCYRGWVDLVYEDQGAPFRLHAGSCVIQPPQILHRVLYASDNIEVIEIGVPAEHVTTIDHEMELPNGPANPERIFDGQKFVHHKVEEAVWSDFRIKGFTSRDTGIAANTGDVAGVHVVKPAGAGADWHAHDSDIHFTFVLEGSMVLEGEGRDPHRLEAGDAFVIPPAMLVRYAQASEDLELLEVSLPGAFKTWTGEPA